MPRRLHGTRKKVASPKKIRFYMRKGTEIKTKEIINLDKFKLLLVL